MGLLDTLYKYGEPALGLLSGAAAEPIAGWAGLLGGGANAVQNTRNALTYQPRTPQGQQGQNALAQALMSAKQTMVDNNPPVAAMVNGYNKLADTAGGYSPLLGAAMQTLPTAAATLFGPGGSQVRSAFTNVAREGAANAMAGSAMRGPMTAQQGAIQWHGTPHTFDKFDAGKIGTGEGAQAYGHGLYLADSPDVAGSYQLTLAHKNNSSLVQNGLNNYDVIAPDGTKVVEGAWLGKASKAKEAYDAAQTSSLYKVDLPDEHIARMLDWDKPLSQQHPDVQGALAKIDPEQWHPSADDYDANQMGQWTYMNLAAGSKTRASTARKAAQMLSDQGIPGIRYLDGGSRSAADGTRNTVLFPGNEHLLQILERNGMPIGGQ